MIQKAVKLLAIAGASFFISILLWISVSVFNIDSHNLTNQQYYRWNAFYMLVDSGIGELE